LVNFPKLWEMTISKATSETSNPCTIHFDCTESGPNGSTRVRRLTCILWRARAKIFILAFGSFWFELFGFSSKTEKPIWSCRLKYSNCYIKPRVPITTEGAWIDSAPSEPSNSSQFGHMGTNVASFLRTNIYKNKETGELSIFVNFGRVYFHWCLSPGRKLRCYGLGLTSVTIVGHFLRVIVGKLFKHIWVQKLFFEYT
jgi:hypothetical protein